MDSYSLNAKEFSERLGTSAGTVSHWLSGRNGPSYEVIVKIIEEFPTVSLNWLILGEGGMHREAAVRHTVPLFTADTSPTSEEELPPPIPAGSGAPGTGGANENHPEEDTDVNGPKSATEITDGNLQACPEDPRRNTSVTHQSPEHPIAHREEFTFASAGKLQMESVEHSPDIIILLPDGTYQRYTPRK